MKVEDEDAAPARAKQSMALLLQARRRSRSAWLYFPHIELLFLFFAFEGALAAQLAAIRENGCSRVVVTAGITLVSILVNGRSYATPLFRFRHFCGFDEAFFIFVVRHRSRAVSTTRFG